MNELHELLDVTQPNVSQHLAALKKKGLVVSHKNGTKRCYRLAKEASFRVLMGAQYDLDAGLGLHDRGELFRGSVGATRFRLD